MNKFTTFFEDALKMLGVLSITMVFVGFVDLKTYYLYFGVNIAEYISTSEIILSSLDSLTVLVISLLIQLLLWLYFFSFLFEWTKEDLEKFWEGKRRPRRYSDDLSIERFTRSRPIRIFALILIIPATLLFILRQYFSHNSFLFSWYLFFALNLFLFMCIYLLGILVTKMVFNTAQKQSRYHPKLVVTIVIFLPSLLFTIYVKNMMFTGNRVRRYGNIEKIKLTLQNDSTLAPNDSMRYLGRTENYIFFWNKNTWTSTILPASGIKSIMVPK